MARPTTAVHAEPRGPELAAESPPQAPFFAFLVIACLTSYVGGAMLSDGGFVSGLLLVGALVALMGVVLFVPDPPSTSSSRSSLKPRPKGGAKESIPEEVFDPAV